MGFPLIKLALWKDTHVRTPFADAPLLTIQIWMSVRYPHKDSSRRLLFTGELLELQAVFPPLSYSALAQPVRTAGWSSQLTEWKFYEEHM